MGCLIYLFQLFDGVVRVDLRRAQAAVPQNLLYRPDIGTFVEQMGRKSMPQHVWTLLLYRRHAFQNPVNSLVNEI